VKTLLENIEGDIDLYITIPEFAAITFSGHAPGVLGFFKNYAGAYLK